MKLKTKIILVCVLTMVTSLIGISIVIVTSVSKSYRKDEILEAYKSTMTVVDYVSKYSKTNNNGKGDPFVDGKTHQLLNNIQQNNSANNKKKSSYGSMLNYLLKNKISTDEEYANIGCIGIIREEDGNKIVYDNCMFSLDEINNDTFDRFASLNYVELSKNGNECVVFTTDGSGYWTEPFDIYCIYSIGMYKEKLNSIIILLVIACLIIVLLELLILMIVLRKIFYPLNELSQRANDIANNEYGKRINVKTKDEIGNLGENFNKMADAVENYIANIEESEKRKSIFMGNLTHELKTPMTAISGYSQLLMNAKLNDEDREEALVYIDEQCQRLSRLSKKMMYLTGLDEEDTIAIEKTRVQMLFENAVNTCSIVAKEKKVVINVEKTDMVVNCDKDLMTEVMINLIDNSIKACAGGGTVSLFAKNNQIVVEDNGCGIPEDDIEKIMEPFYMVDKSRARKNGGAGLGLALTSVILKKHNMKLFIESKEGVGTKATIELEEAATFH